MPTPNTALRAVRQSMLLSQQGLAHAIQEAGRRAGQPNGASKRLVQRWESGAITAPHPIYARALEQATGMPVALLGFDMTSPLTPASTSGRTAMQPTPAREQPDPKPQHRTGQYTGIWLSRYTYPSSGRDGEFEGLHYVVVLQHGNRLTVRSLSEGSSNPNSPLSMDLEVDGTVITGTWSEQTAADGYYRGARYHGAIQLLVEPTGRRMAGKWVGFGKDMDVNTGPWSLTFQDASTTKQALATYNRAPEDPA